MKLLIEIEVGERDDAINIAEAIINHYRELAFRSHTTEEDINEYMHQLEAVADHIKVFLKHYKYTRAGVDI